MTTSAKDLTSAADDPQGSEVFASAADIRPATRPLAVCRTNRPRPRAHRGRLGDGVRDCVKPGRGSAIRVYDSEEPLVLETVHHCSAPLCRSLGGPIDPASSKHHRRSNLKMNTIFWDRVAARPHRSNRRI
jgi:hypothetical protein